MRTCKSHHPIRAIDRDTEKFFSQVVAIAGAETQNPRKIIPNALRMTFFRVLIFYVLSIFVVGILVPYNDENLGISTGTAEQSPFVIAFTRAGIKALPSIINAIVCTSAFSCGSSCVFLASRTLLGMSEEGHAPKFFLKTNRFGTPYLAVAASLIFMPLVYLSLGTSSSVAFGWFVNITTVAGLIGWVVICVTYLRFFYGMKYQGISRDRKSDHYCFKVVQMLNYSRVVIHESITTIHGLGDTRRDKSSRFVLGLQRLLPWQMEHFDILNLLYRHCHFHL